jgi:hypothetical protein
MDLPLAPDARRSGERRAVAWWGLLGAAVGAAALLWWIGLRLDLSRLHVSAMNDQIVYVSVARNFAERGVLASNIIYPATLWQQTPKNFFYMPGHMLSLAASYWALGFGNFSSLLPSLASFVTAVACLAWIAARRYGWFTSLAAGALLTAVPGVLFFAFTAMAESTFLGASLLALAAFCGLRPALRPWLGPLLLAVPFLFRETGALLVLPMMGLIAEPRPPGSAAAPDPPSPPSPPSPGGARRWAEAGLCLLLAVAFLAAVYVSPLAAGRPSLLRANLLGRTDQYVYYDAAAQASLAAAGAADIQHAILANAAANLRAFPEEAFGGDARLHWVIALLGIVLCLGVGLATRDGLLVGGGAMTLAAAALVVCLYNAAADRGLRQLLFTAPLGCLAAARAADLLRRRLAGRGRPLRWAGWAVPVAVLAALLWNGWGQSIAAHRFLSSMDSWGDANVQALERSVKPDDRLALVGPWEYTLEYAFTHHPIRWSFLPQNHFTLALISRAAPIGTALLPLPRPMDRVSAADLLNIGLREVGRVEIRGQRFRVFKAGSLRRGL